MNLQSCDFNPIIIKIIPLPFDYSGCFITIGEEGFVGADPAADAMDAALGSAMDGATEQGGAPGSAAAGDNPEAVMPDPAADSAAADDVDPSAGMG